MEKIIKKQKALNQEDLVQVQACEGSPGEEGS